MSLQPILRPLIRIALGFYYSRIELFGSQRVPARGPLLVVANHPNSVVDAFVLATSIRRRLHFIATVELFRGRALAWLLRHADIIAVNRYSDDARAMRSVVATFERCFKVFDSAGAVALFPEGITHSDPQLKKLKTGAARIALEAEHRRQGELGLHILPVGLNFSRSASYRSTVLVHFGQPLKAAAFLPDYQASRRKAIGRLNEGIEAAIEGLIVHLSDLEDAWLVESVRDLYLDRIAADRSPSPERIAATQAVGDAAAYFKRTEPARFRSFAHRLRRYARLRDQLRLSEKALSRLDSRRPLVGAVARSAVTILAAPVAAYGWLHRLPPVTLVRWATRSLTEPGKGDTQQATAAILAGAVAFSGFFAIYAWLVHRWWGWPLSLWYLLSLPAASLLAHSYEMHWRILADDLRIAGFWLRRPYFVRRLLASRRRLIRELDTFRRDFVSSSRSESPS